MQNQQSYDFMYKVVLIGSSGVGKTNIISRYTKNIINQDQKATIGVEYASKRIQFRNRIIKLQIWDTAGQDRYKSIARAYYKGAIAAFLVYDITCQKSFDDLPDWYNELIQNSTREEIIIITIGNKLDLQANRIIGKQVGERFANQRKLRFFEVSAFTGENIELIFQKLVEDIYYLINRMSEIITIQMKQSYLSRNENHILKKSMLKQNDNVQILQQGKQIVIGKKRCCH